MEQFYGTGRRKAAVARRSTASAKRTRHTSQVGSSRLNLFFWPFSGALRLRILPPGVPTIPARRVGKAIR